jgi:hypothetical protein
MPFDDSRPRDAEAPLDRGAVAMIDALGFKGIWQRHPSREVLKRLLGTFDSTPIDLTAKRQNTETFLKTALAAKLARAAAAHESR